MALDLNNGYQRKDSASASNVYYGYSWNPNATDGDKTFAIRRVNTSNGVETVTWTNGDPVSYNDSWSSRTFSFSPPVGSLGLFGTTSNGYIGSFTWSSLNGVSKYILTANSGGTTLDEFGAAVRNRNYTAIVFNRTSWTQPFPGSGTHSLTVQAVNVSGSTSSTSTLYFS